MGDIGEQGCGHNGHGPVFTNAGKSGTGPDYLAGLSYDSHVCCYADGQFSEDLILFLVL